VVVRHAAEGARGLDPDSDRWGVQVGQGDLFYLDDLYRVPVGARRDRALAGVLLRFVEYRLPTARADVEYPVHLSAHRGDGSADGVGRIEVLGPDDLADARYLVRNEDAAAADGNERAGFPRGLDPVDRLAEHRVGQG
jgi:hypothetical protein